MGVLSFRRKAENACEQDLDWSQQELADFFRAHRLLTQNGVSIGMDRGLSDQGEPWMAFFDPGTLDVFMHVARIDRKCVLVCDPLSIRITADEIGTLIEQFERQVRQYLEINSERASNVVLHPAAKVIMSISAVFLLFKLDNASQAYAREAAAGSSNTDLRKEGANNIARAQSAMGRLFDSVDSPVAIAALASIILASDHLLQSAGGNELGANLLSTDILSFEDGETEALALVSSEKANINFFRDASGDAVIDLASDAGGAEGAQSSISIVQEIDLAAAQMAVPLPVDTPASVQVLAHSGVAPEPAGDADAAQPAAATPDPAKASQPASTTTAEQSTGASSGGNAETSSTGSSTGKPAATYDEAEAVLRKTFNWSWSDTDASKPLTVSLGPKLGLEAKTPEPDAFSIDFDTVDEIISTVGYATETSLSVESLQAMLQHIVSGLGEFDVASRDGRLLIEQHDLQALDASEIGIWTNVMSDGSSISIVGSIDLLDDVGQGVVIA